MIPRCSNKSPTDFELFQNEIKFPRIRNKKTSTQLSDFPTDNEIIDLIEEAKKKASADVLEIGIDVEKTSTIDFKCQVPYENASSDSDDLEYLYDPDDKDIDDIDDTEHVEEFDNFAEDESDPEFSKDLNTISSITGPLNLKYHTYSGIDLSESSPYCIVSDGLGNDKPVRKSTICWLLSKNKHSLSSDRLARVKQSELVVQKNNNASGNSVTNGNILQINEEVNIGDWCIFKRKDRLLIGHVLSFSYLNGTTLRTREFSRTYASVDHTSKGGNVKPNPIGILCTYHRVGDDSTLQQEEQNTSYANLDTYKSTIQVPTYMDRTLRISESLQAMIIDLENEMKDNERKPKWRGVSNSARARDRDIPEEVEIEKVNVLDYVIVKVPTISGSAKCFVGQIDEICTDSFKINFLKKITSKKFADDKFVFPEKKKIFPM